MRAGKRAMDIFGAATGLVLVSPLLGLIALVILLSAGRPVFFRQVRVGQGGSTFRMWKFRTMVAGADRGPQLTVEGDDRIFAAGHVLRRWKLDELPQLLNVLVGDMTLVGPRPEVPRYVDRYTPRDRAVLDLVPGVTDPASVLYRNEGSILAASADPERLYVQTIMPEKIAINLAYAARATLWTDMTVILSTLTAGRFPIAGSARAEPLRGSGENHAG